MQGLLSVSTIGTQGDLSDQQLDERIRSELKSWFGEAASGWELLRIYRIPYAQPDQVSCWLLNART